MVALARELVGRGHSATFLHHPDVGASIENHGLDFRPLATSGIASGSLAHGLEVASRVKGALGIKPLIRELARGTTMLCEELPRVLRALSVDAIVGDWIKPAVGLVAHHLRLPYISVSAALPLNWEPGVPSPFVGWSYGESSWHRSRNIAAQYAAQAFQRPLHDVIRSYSERWGLGTNWSVSQYASGYAQIAQITPSLDYPRRSLIGCLHYCGPFRAPTDRHGPERSRKRTGRAFASLGSLQGHRADIFRRIVDATDAVGLDLTIAHGGLLAPDAVRRLSRRATVHDFVPYDRALRDVDVAIMHGGMNGTMDALSQGVPLVTIPIAFEQSAIASRTRYAGVGLVCPPHALRWRLAGLIREIVENAAYRDAAATLREEIRAAGGVERGADIIEHVARTGRPCLNQGAVEREGVPYAFEPARRAPRRAAPVSEAAFDPRDDLVDGPRREWDGFDLHFPDGPMPAGEGEEAPDQRIDASMARKRLEAPAEAA